MKKLLAAVAVLAPVIALLPASPASADILCAPITIDGQAVCVDTAPVDQAVAETEATVLATIDTVLGLIPTVEGIPRSLDPGAYDGLSHCDGVTKHADGYVTVTAGRYAPTGYLDWTACSGYALKIEASPNTGSLPVHIPQVCLTTTGTCVGGIDTGVPSPRPGYTVCFGSYYEEFDSAGHSASFNMGPDSRCLRGLVP